LKSDIQRVVVIGTSCSGKTTFARQLSDLLDSPHIELDALHWKKNWEPRPRAEFVQIVEESVARDRWVTDGNHGTVRDLVWSRATAVVWLNYPFVLVFSRALSRTFRRAATREQLYSGNTESFTRAFLSRDSILLWVLTSFRRRRREYAALFGSDRFPSIAFLEFRRPRDAALFLSTVKAAAQSSHEADRP
jgi:adenylate kinase family enzyme